MRILVLSRNKKLYSTSRLTKAILSRGHEPLVVDPLKCYMNISTNEPTVHYRGKIFNNIDAVIPRIGVSNTVYGTAVLRQFEVSGVYCLNSSLFIVRSRDKLRVHQLLAKQGVGMPKTSYAHATDSTTELVKMVGGSPLIIKLIEGTQGKGVIKVDTKDAAVAVIDAFRNLDANILVQEYIKEAEGSDLRCFVIGKKVVASMMRTAAPGEFRSNLHLGGVSSPVKLKPKERALAVRIAQLVGLNVAGVDLIRSSKGPLVLEINSSPGLEGIEKTSNVDIADMIIEFIEHNVYKKTRSRGY